MLFINESIKIIMYSLERKKSRKEKLNKLEKKKRRKKEIKKAGYMLQLFLSDIERRLKVAFGKF